LPEILGIGPPHPLNLAFLLNPPWPTGKENENKDKGEGLSD